MNWQTLYMPQTPHPPKRSPSLHHGRAFYYTRWTVASPTPGSKPVRYTQRFYTSSAQTARKQFSAWLKQWKADPTLQDPRSIERGWTVHDLATEYLAFANATYTKRGKITGHVYNVRRALETFNELYKAIEVSDITPPHLARYRDRIIKRPGTTPRSRTTVNEWLGIIKKAFRWAAENGHADPDVALRLTVVSNIPKNRTAATEPTRREAVHPDIIEQTIAHADPQLADMVRVQYLTGMRPGELCLMRACDIDRTGPAWIYTVAEDKNVHRENRSLGDAGRRVAIGPQAQQILAKYLDTLTLTGFLFQPKRAPRANRKHTRAHYDHNAYRRAITRATDRADKTMQLEWQNNHPDEEIPAARFIPHWTPYQLRHARKKLIEAEFGIEAARSVLGHTKTSTTDLYATHDLDRATEVAIKTG